jgi:hypothetical protein
LLLAELEFEDIEPEIGWHSPDSKHVAKEAHPQADIAIPAALALEGLEWVGIEDIGFE